MSDKPPLNIARYIKELKAYPHGCFEQTASGLFPSFYIDAAQLQVLGIRGDGGEKHRASVDIGISRLLQMQCDNGDFTLQDKNGDEEYWLMAYVMDFLVRADEQGYNVSISAINRGNERLLCYLQGPGMMSTPYADSLRASKPTVQSYAVLVLIRQQKAPLGALREIWEHRADAASSPPLLQPGVAPKTIGDVMHGGEVTVLALKTPCNSDERIWLGDHGSPPHDSMLMPPLLEENKLLPGEQYSPLNAFSQQALGERWLSTRESNVLFLAAYTLQGLPGKWQVQTTFSAGLLIGEKAQTSNLNNDQFAALQVTNNDDQPLWLRVDASGYPQPAPSSTSDVLQIERHILGTSGKSKSLDSLRNDGLVLVRLQVKANNGAPDALVVDPLLAGPELENQSLASGSASLEQSGGEVQNLLNQMQQASIKYVKFRDDRFVAAVAVGEHQPITLVYLAQAVTPGTYQVLQSMVESMYVP